MSVPTYGVGHIDELLGNVLRFADDLPNKVSPHGIPLHDDATARGPLIANIARALETRMRSSQPIFPEKPHALYEQHGYSPAIRSDNLVFVSGQVGSLPDGSPEPDYGKQVRLAFANLEAVLAATGCGLDDIVDVTTFHTNPAEQFEDFFKVKQEKFPDGPYPAWTALGVNWLAGFDFEIKVVAKIPAKT